VPPTETKSIVLPYRDIYFAFKARDTANSF